MLLSSLLLLFVGSASKIDAWTVKAGRCDISIKYREGDMKEPQPLLLADSSAESVEPIFLMPSAPQLVSMPAGAKILVACPGRGNSFQNLTSEQSVELECIGGKKFRFNETTLPFSSFMCKRIPSESVRKLNYTCLDARQAYQIGFQVKKAFLPTIEICRDETSYRTYYAKERIPKEIGHHQSGFPRHSWKYRGYFGGYAMNRIYKRTEQLKTLQLLLGKSGASAYISPKLFLNRGHLAANADFMYGAQQMTSMWHLNCLPQWTSFNAGNWRILEVDVRLFAGRYNKDLIVYTGAHGVLTLPDEAGKQQEIYLFANESTKAFPVPKFFWKIIQDPISKKATAFVGLNNVFANQVSDDMYLCPDIGEAKRFSWLSWKPNNITWGFSYICTVEDLRKSVPAVPDIEVTGLLTN